MDFIQHAQSCEECKSVDISKPATLVNCCLVGAPLLRDHISEEAEKKHKLEQKRLKNEFTKATGDGKNYKTTKAKLKELTRYKDW